MNLVPHNRDCEYAYRAADRTGMPCPNPATRTIVVCSTPYSYCDRHVPNKIQVGLSRITKD